MLFVGNTLTFFQTLRFARVIFPKKKSNGKMIDTIICAIISDMADGVVIVAVDGESRQSTVSLFFRTAAGPTEATVAAGTDVGGGRYLYTHRHSF